MGDLKLDRIQLGQNATATQNFTFKQGADGTMTLARGNAGATSQDILTIDADGVVTLTQQDQIKSGTAIDTTSGTSHDFTGIPSWVKKITVMLSGVSTNGASDIIIQLGSSGGIEATGYDGVASTIAATSVATSNYTNGISLRVAGASHIRDGIVEICNLDGNTWSAKGSVARSETSAIIVTAASKSLSGVLDRLRLTTAGGTDTFDAGKINILYEG